MSVVDLIVEALERFDPVVKISDTGSAYIKLAGSKVKEIRVSNHNSRKLARNVWQLRTDAMTHRTKFNRIYNVRDIRRMIADVN